MYLILTDPTHSGLPRNLDSEFLESSTKEDEIRVMFIVLRTECYIDSVGDKLPLVTEMNPYMDRIVIHDGIRPPVG